MRTGILWRKPHRRGAGALVEGGGCPFKEIFNTSGLKYKSLGLKDQLAGMTEEEQLTLLASDGMLVKRPDPGGRQPGDTGFKPEDWENFLER